MPAKRTQAARSIDAHLGARLREVRELRGMSQGELAGRLGLQSRQAVASYEAGDAISAAALFQLTVILQVDVGRFYDGLAIGQLAEGSPASPHAARIMTLLAQAPAAQHATILKVVRALVERPGETAGRLA